jgi:hypothetical protein
MFPFQNINVKRRVSRSLGVAAVHTDVQKRAQGHPKEAHHIERVYKAVLRKPRHHGTQHPANGQVGILRTLRIFTRLPFSIKNFTFAEFMLSAISSMHVKALPRWQQHAWESIAQLLETRHLGIQHTLTSYL